MTTMKEVQMNRNYAIDGFRGLLLVVIAINHIESAALAPITTTPFGFVSAAEAFILLSGFMAAMVYGRLADNPIALKLRIWKRVSQLYLFTMAGVLVIYISLHSQLLPDIWYRDWGNYFLLENYLTYPIEALLLNIIQIQQMGYLDILVLYMVSMFFLPWALLLLHRKKGLLVFSLSAAIWLAAHFINDSYLAEIFQMLQLQTKVDAGYMDIMAWQFLFYLGVIAGYYQKFTSVDIIANRKLTFVVSLLAIVFLLMHKVSFILPLPTYLKSLFYSWKDVGLIRLLNTLVLAYMAALLICKLPKIFMLKPLVFLGQYSLTVFTFHGVAIYFFLPWMYQINNNYTVWADVALVMTFIATLFIPAYFHHQWRALGRNNNQQAQIVS